MIQSCVTVSLVPEARGGPFVFWDDLPAACRTAAELGFDAIEIFAPGAEALASDTIRPLLDEFQLRLAAVGTGAGWVRHKLHLCDADAGVRERAVAFIREIIDAGAKFGAPAIIGSMQGRWGNSVDQPTARDHLRRALDELSGHAKRRGVPLLLEPLNRYETNMVNTLREGCRLLRSLAIDNVALLADLFHMNIEEDDIAVAVRDAASAIGHVHFVDSNRRAAGSGHIDFTPIAAALRETGYSGYLSAEAVSYPDAITAARLTIDTFRRYFGEARSE
jgi:sugar phosphate isomerase/epimerase